MLHLFKYDLFYEDFVPILTYEYIRDFILKGKTHCYSGDKNSGSHYTLSENQITRERVETGRGTWKVEHYFPVPEDLDYKHLRHKVEDALRKTCNHDDLILIARLLNVKIK